MSATDTTAERTDVLVNPLDDVLGYQLRRASIATMAALGEAYDALGVKLTEAVILRFVSANPGCNQSAIGRALGVKRTNMVPIVADLETRGLLHRAPADGRSNALTLTPAGHDLLEQVKVAASRHEARFFGDVSEDLRQQMLALFRKIRAEAGA